jgi:hypothetical protein
MAQAIKLPSLAGTLAGTPLLPRPGLLPNRVTPRLFPRLISYAGRVRMHRHAVGTVAEADLIPKFISNTVDADGIFHEYYVLDLNGNPEGFMDLATGPKEVDPNFEKNVGCEITRCGYAVFDVYLDDVLQVTFPEITATTPKPWVGYTAFWIPM